MIRYVEKVIAPSKKRAVLKLDKTYPALAIFDCFRGQTTPAFYALLRMFNIISVLVPPNATDKLQPLDISFNKPMKDKRKIRKRFHTWHAKEVQMQLETVKVTEVTVDVSAAVIKAKSAGWFVSSYVNHGFAKFTAATTSSRSIHCSVSVLISSSLIFLVDLSSPHTTIAASTFRCLLGPGFSLTSDFWGSENSFLTFIMSLGSPVNFSITGTSSPPSGRSAECCLSPVIVHSMLPFLRRNREEMADIFLGRTGQIFEQSRSSEETDRNVDVSTAKVFVSTMLKKVESDWPNIYSNLVTL